MVPLIVPFRGLRYVDCGNVSRLIAPPYDVISPERRESLAEGHPCNIVHITLPEDPHDPYEQAARLLAEWRWNGGMRLDEVPTVTVMQQLFDTPDGASHVRTGLFALIAAEPYEQGRVRPHERTHEGAREDRLRLLKATRAATEPIFLVAPDPEGRLGALLASLTTEEPDAVAGLDDVEIRLWVADGGRAAEALEATGAHPLYVADGHHRYETAVAYAQARKEEGRTLGFVVPLNDPGLVVLPTHRLLTGSPVAAAEGAAALTGARPCAEDDEADCTIVWSDGSTQPYMVTAPQSGAERELRIMRVEREIVAPLHGLLGPESSLSYTADEAEARAKISSGEAAAAVLVRPTPMSDVVETADEGGIMPPKTTHFFPKVPSGLVLWPVT